MKVACHFTHLVWNHRVPITKYIIFVPRIWNWTFLDKTSIWFPLECNFWSFKLEFIFSRMRISSCLVENINLTVWYHSIPHRSPVTGPMLKFTLHQFQKSIYSKYILEEFDQAFCSKNIQSYFSNSWPDVLNSVFA